MIRRLWNRQQVAMREAHVPDGMRIYAIGDLHGEAGLLLKMMRKISAELDDSDVSDIRVIFLGDLIDRGTNSRVLLESLSRLRHDNLILLKGNHEATLVDSYRGNESAFRFWLEYGGLSTLRSFGIEAADEVFPDPLRLRDEMHAHIDPALIDWLDELPVSHIEGDYLFVHAGIKPGRELDEQTEEDILWMREPFLSSTVDHGKVVVHGHTVCENDVALGGNRIGIDTGAYEHGCLTALGLQGAHQWTISVRE